MLTWKSKLVAMLKTLLLTASTVIASLILPATITYAGDMVNVYSARHYDTDLALYDDFEKRTGIKVNLIEAGSDALIERIKNEGKYSPADVLITVDAGRLYRAEQKGLFESFQSELLEKRIPAHLRHPEGQWYGLSKRARVIIYNKEQGLPEGLNRYEDLADAKYANQLCVRSSSNIYNISMLAGMIDHNGAEGAERWATQVVSNLKRPPQGNDTANIRAVASGECRLSIVNSYYVARLRAAKSPIGDAVGIIFPNQETTGTHVNISGAGILKYAPNKANAQRFIEYLTEAPAQYLYVEGNNEYPVVVDAKLTDVIAAMGSFKDDEINANVLGENQSEAVRIFDRAGWN